MFENSELFLEFPPYLLYKPEIGLFSLLFIEYSLSGVLLSID